MNNLLNFLVKHTPWFLFAFYLVISLMLLFKNNPYQQSVYLSSANSITASVYEGYNSVSSYFGLRDINEQLEQANADQEEKIIALQNELEHYKAMVPDSTGITPSIQQFEYVMAHVISNSVNQPANYITIDRGSDDGISPEMGVVDHNGVVGIVNVVGHHSARIISLLNPNMKLSCKVKSGEGFGSLTWDGSDPTIATLQDLPRQGQYNKGDTVITSGYSTVFPEGIMVGIVMGTKKEVSGNFTSLIVKLSTDFTRLSNVRAFKNTLKVELKALETKDQNPNESPEAKKERLDKEKKEKANKDNKEKGKEDKK